MYTFYWLIDGILAGASRPGVANPHARPSRSETPLQEDSSAALERDLTWLRAQGITAILSLTETALPEAVVAEHGLIALHLAVPDLHAPTPEQLLTALSFIDHQQARGRAVVVHCLVGQGRTGTVLAAHHIRGGVTPETAIAKLRALSPGAISSPSQEQALRTFAARQDWLL